MSEINIRLRSENEATNHDLGVGDPEEVMALVRSYGVLTDDVHHSVAGQFVIDEDGAYFEIIVFESGDAS